MTRSMRAQHRLSLLLLAALLAALVSSCAQASNDPFASWWNFSNLQSKAQARVLAAENGLLANLSRPFLAPDVAQGLQAAFEDWSAKEGVRIPALQESEALFNFWSNLQLVYAVNMDSSRPFWCSANAFSHLSFDQFQRQALGRRGPIRPPPGRLLQAAGSGSYSGQLLQDPTQNQQGLRTEQPVVTRMMEAGGPADMGQAGGGGEGHGEGSSDRQAGGASKWPGGWASKGHAGAGSGGTSTGSGGGGWHAGRHVLQALPSAVDWVSEGKVTAVKNQTGCAASWAFAATAAIESMHLIRIPNASGPRSIDLSEQELIDCCRSSLGCMQSRGCSGGVAREALTFASSWGLMLSQEYPFSIGTSSSCRFNVESQQPAVRTVGAAVVVQPGDELALMQAVAVAPVVVGFEVTDTFRSYAGGLYTGAECGSRLNHAMVVVGYNASGPDRYWILKNSWGTGWGERGYARVRMSGDRNGTCGMYLEPLQPPREFSVNTTGSDHHHGYPTEVVGPMHPPPAVPAPSPPPPPDPCACLPGFVYLGQRYEGCTNVDQDDGRYWCIVSPQCSNPMGIVYNTTPPDMPFIYCNESQITRPPAPPRPPPGQDPCACVFPFTYQGRTYSQCTPYNDNRLWCVVSNLCTQPAGWYDDTDGRKPFIYCPAPPGMRYYTPPPPPSPGSPSTAPCPCTFPFTYKGRSFMDCTTFESLRGRAWCMADTSGGPAPPDDPLPEFSDYFYEAPGAWQTCHADGAIFNNLTEPQRIKRYFVWCEIEAQSKL